MFDASAPLDASRVRDAQRDVDTLDAYVARDAEAHDAFVSPLTCPAQQFGLARVDVGELQLNVACQGSGKPILMLHGYPEFYQAWNKLAPPLVAAGYRVIAPDQRGYNLSDKPEPVAAYGMDHLEADMLGLLDAIGESRVLIVAHDWGGTVAYVFAHRHPERVRGLVTMNSPHPDVWGHPEVDPTLARAGDGYIPLIAGPLGATALLVVEPMLAPYLSADEVMAYHASWDQPHATDSMSKWYQANNYPTYTLPSHVIVEAPTLALAGEDDIFVTPSQLDHLPDYVTHLQAERIAGVDHWMTHQLTDVLLGKILAFDRGL
jgi:pimeloyl-ACP methyl ester carboxylesterase